MKTFAFAVVALMLIACNPGVGEGALTGTLTAVDCDLINASYDMEPDFFVGETTLSGLIIRVQHGSDLQVRSDGFTIDLTDLRDIYANKRGEAIALRTGDDAEVHMTLHLNSTCHADRDAAPVLMQAESGNIVFDELYSPEDDSAERIVGRFYDVVLRDPGSPSRRFGRVSGSFDFIYNRGRPAQRYP